MRLDMDIRGGGEGKEGLNSFAGEGECVCGGEGGGGCLG